MLGIILLSFSNKFPTGKAKGLLQRLLCVSNVASISLIDLLQTTTLMMTNNRISEEQVSQFLQEVKTELSGLSVAKTMGIMRIMFSKLRASYTSQQAEEIIAKTPASFQLMFTSNWHYEVQEEIGHLDELVDRMFREDQHYGVGMFKSELDVLRIVTVVLSKIQVLFKLAGIRAFSYNLTHELQQAVQERS
jgi:uncharacterized protein (DUF2267 family)